MSDDVKPASTDPLEAALGISSASSVLPDPSAGSTEPELVSPSDDYELPQTFLPMAERFSDRPDSGEGSGTRLFTKDDPRSKNTKTRKKKVSKRVHVKSILDELGFDPFIVLAHLANNTPESRAAIGLKSSEVVSPTLRAKCAIELAGYIAPKLKSTELKVDGDKNASGVRTTVFIPSNGREQEEAMHLNLPDKDLDADTAKLIAAELDEIDREESE